MPSVLWCCWLGGRNGIWPVKTERCVAGVVICLWQGADLHMAQLMPLPLTVSCFSKIHIGFTFLVLGTSSPGWSRTKSRWGGGVKRLCVCVIDSVWHAYMLVVQHCYALICVSTQLVLDIWFTLDCGFTLFSLFLNICAYTCIHLFVSILPDFGGQCLCCHTCLVCYFVWLCHFTFSCLRQFFSYISRLTC